MINLEKFESRLFFCDSDHIDPKKITGENHHSTKFSSLLRKRNDDISSQGDGDNGEIDRDELASARSAMRLKIRDKLWAYQGKQLTKFMKRNRESRII